MRILVVEDELELLHDIARGLRKQGYAVDEANQGAAGYQMAVDESYDIVILDLNLPQMSGLEILKLLKEEKPYLPVLILSANSQLETKLNGFSLGASDYVTKPFHFAELEARIRVLLGRGIPCASTSLAGHGIEMNVENRTVRIGEQNLSLTSKETGLLEYFLRNPGRLITQQELIEHVWDGDFNPFSNSIRVHLSALRKKLRAALGEDPITTKIGEGYIFQ